MYYYSIQLNVYYLAVYNQDISTINMLRNCPTISILTIETPTFVLVVRSCHKNII